MRRLAHHESAERWLTPAKTGINTSTPPRTVSKFLSLGKSGA
jgi:hypothetical protein